MRRRQKNVAEVGLGVVVWRARRYNEEEKKGISSRRKTIK